ncbi:MAG: glycosyltransferase family 4 protein [Oscillospiraceae bacterium]|nr:glycosyltransferase family 4 protein [Oscillospiraceae bacterium]
MKRVLFVTNVAAPYRVSFFEELSREMEVTVLLTDSTEQHQTRNAAWFVSRQVGYRQVQLEKCLLTLGGERLCTDVLDWLKKPWDAIVVCGYSSPTVLLAMAWLRLRGIPFYMEVDGGLIREESRLKYRFKKLLVTAADRWISSGAYTTQYLAHYGAREEDTSFYPFSSLREADILSQAVSREEKCSLRRELGIGEANMVLSIGQFIPRKGFDVLLRAAAKLQPDTGIYIVGGEPTEEYLRLREELDLTNIHFVGFLKKEELANYYRAADVFVLPTREDIWGLVINEAMACGLPVVTTDKCVAGLELIEEGISGYIVPVDDPEKLAEKLNTVLSGDPGAMGAAALEKIRPYTIENMARAHVEIFNQQE